MVGSIEFTGMVLSAMPVLDYDRRIVVLTKEQGKISAFARSARKPNSHLVAATSPFIFAEFEAYQGKNSVTITKAKVSNHFEGITADYDKICLGSYFLEVAEYFSVEGGDELERLKLLYQILRVLDSGEFDSRLLRTIYDLKTMVINGEFYDSKSKQAESLSDTGKYTLEFINVTPVEKLFKFKLSDQALNEMEDFARKCRNRFFNHTFKTEAFLDI